MKVFVVGKHVYEQRALFGLTDIRLSREDRISRISLMVESGENEGFEFVGLDKKAFTTFAIFRRPRQNTSKTEG